jgi:hypothetical protein
MEEPTLITGPFLGEESQFLRFLDPITNTTPTFEDNFSTPKPEWDIQEKAVIDSGALQISVENDHDVRVGGDHLVARNFVIQFDFNIVGDESTSVGFEIRNENALFEIMNDQWMMSDEDEVVFSGVITNPRTEGWNTVTIFTQGNQFALYYNADRLTAFTRSIPGESNAFHADSISGTVYIDNLKFWDLDKIELVAEDTPVPGSTSSVMPEVTATRTPLHTPVPTADLRVLNPDNGHFYLHSQDAGFQSGAYWVFARNYCESLGGYLATVEDESENEFVSQWGNVFLGATADEEGTWSWVTGEPWEYENWRDGHPDNPDGLGILNLWLGEWHNFGPDDVQMPFVCEWDPEPNPPPEERAINPDNNHLYISRGFHSWEFARNDCASMGGYLATIGDAAESEFLYGISYQDRPNWLGATDSEQEGTWVWITGEPWIYENWNPGEPRNSSGDEDYLAFHPDSGWSAIDVTEEYLSGHQTARLPYICEWDPEPETPEPTPTSTPDERVLNPDNQHLYLYSGSSSRVEPQIWPLARDFCDSQGGYLVTIQDAAENNFIYQLTSAPSGLVFLGGSYNAQGNSWDWITGEPFEYENWAVGKPSNQFNDYYLAFGDGKYWHDTTNDERNFICEWDPEPDRLEPTPTPTEDRRTLNPENQHLYRWYGDPSSVSGTNWKVARDYCEAVGGYLVTIQNAAENELVDELSMAQVWIGATDEEEEGTWVWITGETWDYTNWNTNQPTNEDGKHYLFLDWQDMWSDGNLSQQMDFVCEWDPEPEAPESTPMPPPANRIFNPENEHYYFDSWSSTAVSNKVWHAAKEYCERHGGYLATIQDAEENAFVYELLSGGNSWLGATDEEQEGTWVWVTGEPWDYADWPEGGPTSGEDEHYLFFDYWHGHWGAGVSTYEYPGSFICEWDADPDPRASVGEAYSPIFEYIGSNLPTFKDTFSTAKNEWGSTSAGYWIPNMLQDEILVVMSPGVDTEFPVNGLFQATDFVLSFDFHPNKDETGVLGLIFRSSESLGTYYQFKISYSWAGYLTAWLFSYSDGSIVRTTKNGSMPLPNEYNKIELVVRGEDVWIFINGDLEFEMSGLESWGDDNYISYPQRGDPQGEGVTVSFDNFKFWNLDGVEFD